MSDPITLYEQYFEERDKEDCDSELRDSLKRACKAAITQTNINLKNAQNKTLLHLATEDGDMDMVEFLLAKKAKIDITDGYNLTAMYNLLGVSIKDDFIERERIIRKFQELGADIDECDALGRSQLHSAVITAFVDKILLLLKLGAKVSPSKPNRKPMLSAVAWFLKGVTELNDSQTKALQILFENHMGLGAKFDEVTNIKLISAFTEGMLLIGATINGKLITNDTPGFEKAICTADQFLKLLNERKNKFNLKVLQENLEGILRSHENNSPVTKPVLNNNGLVEQHVPAVDVPVQSVVIDEVIDATNDVQDNSLPLDEASSTAFPVTVTSTIEGQQLTNLPQLMKVDPARLELEKLYKIIRERLIGTESLKGLISAKLLLQHGFHRENVQPVIDTSLNLAESQKVPGDVIGAQPGLSAENVQPITDTRLNTTEPHKLPGGILNNQPALNTEKMKVVADAILDPDKLNALPLDIIAYIEELGNKIEEELGHRRTTSKVVTK